MQTSTAPPVVPKKVSPAGYWIAAAIWLVGITAAIVWFVVTLVGAINAPNDFDRTAVPGSMTLDLGTGTWVVYHEYNGANQSTFGYTTPPLVDVVVTDAQGDEVYVDYYTNTSFNYDTGNHEGTSLAEFEVDRAGTYEITATGEPRPLQSVAVGRQTFDSGFVAALLGSFALGALAFIVGLVILIVTIVRRSRYKKAVNPPSNRPLTGPYGGYPGMAPAPPYPGAPNPTWGPPGSPTGYGAPSGYPPQTPSYPPPTSGYPPPAGTGYPAQSPGAPSQPSWPQADAAPPAPPADPSEPVAPAAPPEPSAPAPSPWNVPGESDTEGDGGAPRAF